MANVVGDGRLDGEDVRVNGPTMDFESFPPSLHCCQGVHAPARSRVALAAIGLHSADADAQLPLTPDLLQHLALALS